MKLRKKSLNDKFKKNLLLFTKISFITFIILFTLLFLGLTIYSKNIDYYMPKLINYEIYDRDNNLISKINSTSNKNYVKIDDINQNIIDAFLSIEDKEFYEHQGINFKRIIGALIADIKNGEFSQGGSTITQQYVKNTFLDSSKTIKRKIDEALISINIESKYTKDEILEGYLNTIYFDHGITGIYDACMFYFNKEPSEISLNESCVLAAIPKAPSNYSPIRNHDNNDRRRILILKELLNDEKITLATYNQNINDYPPLYGKLQSHELKSSPYFVDIILKQIENNKYKIDKDQTLKIYTTLDSDLNKIAEKYIKKYYTNEDLELAIVCYDTSGNVLANIGGSDYMKSTYNRTFSLRQPGSTIKPFLYYAALNNGFNVSTTFYSGPTTFFYQGNEYSPKNFNNIYPNDDITMAYAIATSDNVYALKTHLFLGTDMLYNTLLDFGFTSKITNNPSLALGTSEVSLNELTLGYAKIASKGLDLKETYVNKITDNKGKILYENNNKFEQKFNSKTCYLLSEALTNTFDGNIRINISPTCSQIKQFLTTTYAAKTGSTDYDGLIIGYNQNVCLGIWTGNDQNMTINNQDTKYIRYIWAQVMEEYNKKKYKNLNTWFNTHENVIAIKLNPITGNIDDYSSYRKYLYYDINNLPSILY